MNARAWEASVVAFFMVDNTTLKNAIQVIDTSELMPLCVALRFALAA